MSKVIPLERYHPDTHTHTTNCLINLDH